MPASRGIQGERRGQVWRETVTLTIGMVWFVYGTMIRPDDTTAPPSPAAWLLAAVSLAALLARHRAPRAGMAVTVACGLLGPPLDLLITPPLLGPVMIAAYTLGTRPERRETNAIMAVSAVLLAASSLAFQDTTWEDAGQGMAGAFPVLACALARSVTDRRAYLGAVEERAKRAEESRESEARRRVAEERLRIARELHDVVAHHITLANAQAQVAAHLFDARPDQARASLRKLSETTRDALDELRATVGLLRRSGESGESGESGASPTPLEPAPGLAQLTALVASFERAGLRVAVRREGPARPLAPGADLTAYRIIQEALTNVTKHAATATARVGLVYDRDRLTLTVADDGRPTGTGTDTDSSHGGYGLIGMRERAAAAGGRLTAGRGPGGGFLVTSELPLPPRRRTADADPEAEADAEAEAEATDRSVP